MAAGDLVTLDAVKDWLSIDLDDHNADDLLNRIIAATSAFVKQVLNNPVIPTQCTETYDGYGKDYMVLRRFPVISVDGLWCLGTVMPAATGNGQTQMWQNGYVLSDFDGAHQLLTLYGKVFPNRRSSVVVKYTAGWATTPMDIQQAVWELVGARYRYMDRIGYTSKSLGGQETVSFAPNRLDDYSKGLLTPYMRVAPV